MKKKINNKYKITLKDGVINLSQTEMIIVLNKREINRVCGDEESEGILTAMLFPPKSYHGFTDEKLIQGIQKCFSNLIQIQEILRKQKEGLKLLYSQLEEKDKEMLKVVREEWAKAGM